MHRHHIALSFTSALVFFGLTLIVGCGQFSNLEMPKSVAIKTDAEYNAALGTASYNPLSSISLDSLKSTMQDALGSAATVYDYIPNTTDDTLTYLIHYPVYSVPIDVGSYLDQLDISQAFNTKDTGLGFNSKIPVAGIPDDKKSITQSTAVDVDKNVRQSMNETLATGDTIYPTVVEPGSVTAKASEVLRDGEGNAHNSLHIEGTIAKEITYRSGSGIIIQFTKNDQTAVSDNFHINLTAKIVETDNVSNTIATSQAVDVREGGSLYLDIGNVVFPQKVDVVIDGTLTGGDTSISHSYSTTLSMAEDTSVRKVAGITTSDPSKLGLKLDALDSISQTIDLSDMKGYFEYMIVGEGAVSIKATLPNTWTCENVTATSTFDFNGIGLNHVAPSPVVGATELVNKKLDLAGRTLTIDDTSSTIAVTGNVSLSLLNATIDFGETPPANSTVDVIVNTSITKIAEAKINFKSGKYDGVKTSYALPTDGSSGSILLPDELIQYVDSIDFCSTDDHYKHSANNTRLTDADGKYVLGKGFGITCTIVNTLPTGNALTGINLKSNFFKFNKDVELTESKDESWNDYPLLDLTGYRDGASHYVDFTFTMPETLVVKNLVVGDTYEIGLSNAQLVYDWDSIVFDPSSKNVSGSTNLSSFDIKSILSSLNIPDDDLQKVQVAALPVFFFAERPESNALASTFESMSINGLITATYDGLTDPTLIYGETNTKAKELSFVSAVDWSSITGTRIDTTNGSSIISKLTKVADDAEKPYSIYYDLASLLNANPKNLMLNYNVALSGSNGSSATVYAATIDAISSSSSTDQKVDVSIDMAAILAVKFNLIGQINLNIMKYTDDTWETDGKDLLSRQDKSTYEEYASYADAIESFKVDYTITNTLIPNLPLSITITDAASSLNKTASFNNGHNAIELKASEIKNIMTTYPFHPDVYIQLGDSNASATNPEALFLSRSALEAGDMLKSAVAVKVKMNGDNSVTVWGGNE